MAEDRIDGSRLKWASSSVFKFLFFTILTVLLSSCAYTDNLLDIKREVQIPKAAASPSAAEKTPAPLKTPDFVPVHEDVSPVKTRIVDLSARNTPLRDVLFIVAEATGLNLVMERDVNPEIPITLSLKNVTAEDALNKIFTSVDYFYTIKDNMLYVKATDTKVYELGHPSIIQAYSTDLGGDILGAAMSGKSGGGGSNTLKGAISQKSESDKSAYNFWEVIEKSVEKLLGPAGGSTAPGQQSFSVNRLTGTILVTATKKNLGKVETYINTVKQVMSRQVLVEAKVIEVTLSDSLQFGIDWTSVLSFSDRRVTSLSTANFSGIATATPTTPVFVASTIAPDLSAILKAIQVQGEIRILSNPRVNITNGQTAILGVGTNTSYISKIETTQTTTAGSAPTITFTVDTGSVLSGIMIGIVPYISESGEISMSVTPIVSDLVKLESQGLGTTDSAGNRPYLIQLPQIDLRQLSTTVKVRSGQMIVIGGLIAKREVLQDSQIPGLGSIPVLGYFFKSRNKVVKNYELVVLLQPVIVSR
ncbi:MAG: hypothetical protein NTV58_19250 [Deltaproteobacteria bacterium]|nr:hypothetical protein [Deltaproteobacteria bacterium]